jgi:hypothetical protein
MDKKRGGANSIKFYHLSHSAILQAPSVQATIIFFTFRSGKKALSILVNVCLKDKMHASTLIDAVFIGMIGFTTYIHMYL